MTEKLSRDFLLGMMRPWKMFIGQQIRHLKTGGLYQIRDLHFREHDMELCFEYSMSNEPLIKFSRPIGELVDGRFKILGEP